MLKKHSVSIRGHRTSFSLEDEFWQEFRTIARSRNLSTARLITQIDAARDAGQNLSSAIRLFVLQELKSKSQQPAITPPSS